MVAVFQCVRPNSGVRFFGSCTYSHPNAEVMYTFGIIKHYCVIANHHVKTLCTPKKRISWSNSSHSIQVLSDHHPPYPLPATSSKITIKRSINERNNSTSEIICLKRGQSSSREALISNEWLLASDRGGDIIGMVDGPDTDILDERASTRQVVWEVCTGAGPASVTGRTDGDDVSSGRFGWTGEPDDYSFPVVAVAEIDGRLVFWHEPWTCQTIFLRKTMVLTYQAYMMA